MIEALLSTAKHYLQHIYTEEAEVNNAILNWLDAMTDEGYTVVHFAAFRGNLPLLTFFHQSGADLTLVNKQKLNIVHISAQGDQAGSLTFCRINMDPKFFLSRDTKGGTPLHWASFLGCENAVNFLCAWQAKSTLNIQDYEGLTPLHLAVLSGNSRILRKLLVRGGDRFIQDNKGMMPYDIAKENSCKNMMEMLVIKNGIIEKCNIRPSYKLVRK